RSHQRSGSRPLPASWRFLRIETEIVGTATAAKLRLPHDGVSSSAAHDGGVVAGGRRPAGSGATDLVKERSDADVTRARGDRGDRIGHRGDDGRGRERPGAGGGGERRAAGAP